MAKRGRKGKYETNVLPHLDKIREWRKVGGTIEHICDTLGIGRSTWHEYEKKHPEFADAIKKGTTEFCLDLRGELAKLAKKHTLETKKQYIKKDPETGLSTKYTEITVKEVDADIAAINLLLKNLDKENWSNDPQNLALRKQELELRKQIAESNNWMEE